MFRFFPRKTISLLAICVSFGLITSAGGAAEPPQKLRVAYAAVTAAFSIPWIAKEAGIFQPLFAKSEHSDYLSAAQSIVASCAIHESLRAGLHLSAHIRIISQERL